MTNVSTIFKIAAKVSRHKLGIYPGFAADKAMFYNSGITSILKNMNIGDEVNEKLQDEADFKLCLDMLDDSATVEIRMTTNDYIRLTRNRNVLLADIFASFGK